MDIVSGDLSSLATAKHPVHFVTEDGKLSPSAFIPFCEFGGDDSIMGRKIQAFKNISVCNSFKAKIFNDQLCYEVDLQKFRDDENIEKQLKLGFAFFMDYNEDRQVTSAEGFIPRERSYVLRIINSGQRHQAFIHLNTVGEIEFHKCLSNLYFSHSEPVQLIGEGDYNLNVVKDIAVTESYNGLPQSVRGCQNQEPFENCTSRIYFDSLMAKCGCLPFNMRLTEKVANGQIFFKIEFI